MESLTPSPRGGFSSRGAGFTHRRTAATSLFSLTGALGQQHQPKLILQKPSQRWFPGKKKKNQDLRLCSNRGRPTLQLRDPCKGTSPCLGLPEHPLPYFPPDLSFHFPKSKNLATALVELASPLE